MNTANMQTLPLELEFLDDDSLAGFRLHYFEVLNWGTFDATVWRLESACDNALLTGDIGSGKSTLVDAVTSLLVPHHRIVYNKAAGAESRERTLASYVRGEYKSEKDDFTQSAKAVALRAEDSYSVLLAHFFNRGYDTGVTLAQVFWLKEEHQKNPDRFFVVADQPLTIVEHFTGFGADINRLKKRLRQTERVSVFDTFKDYGTRFRQFFGIQHEQALELFYQTVSMKSVGNLTDFVRLHMLEKSAVEHRIEELRRSFDNLNRAHESVLKAKRQIELLTPLVAEGAQHQRLTQAIEQLARSREALVAYYAGHKSELLVTKLERLALELQKIAHRLECLKQSIEALRAKESDLRYSIEDHGGRRIQELEREMQRLGDERDRRNRRQEDYNRLAVQLELEQCSDEARFFHNRSEAGKRLQAFEQQVDRLQTERDNKAIELNRVRTEHDQISAELDSLRRRKTNIPRASLEIRAQMAEVLNVPEEDLPFIGELLQVDEQARAWEGAIERLLHNFGLSLVAPEQLYSRISHYVDKTHLRGRLVYFRVRDGDIKKIDKTSDINALVRKLRIKPDSAFYTWLESQLNTRFDYICCETLEDFRRHPYAITRNGQIKSGQQRHEKDDRRSIHDRSHYVLGWSNEHKIRTLEHKQQHLQQQGRRAEQAIAGLDQQRKTIDQHKSAATILMTIEDFSEIHWQPIAEAIQCLADEKQRIEQSSDILKSLQNQLEETIAHRRKEEDEHDRWNKESGKTEQQTKDHRSQLEESQQFAGLLTDDEKAVYFPKLDELRSETQPGVVLNLQNLVKSERELREAIQRRHDNESKKRENLGQKIVRLMQAYKTDYPAETADADASLAALDEFRSMLDSLQNEDLPRHEARFKEMLNEGTIQGIAMFQNQLDKERQEIDNKIRAINTSLKEIEYNSGAYITLVMDKTQDREVRDFQQDLRNCLAHGLEDDALYDEGKFLQVKAIVERFNGREGSVDADVRWTRKVTDVRNWFVFSASERWLEDDAEKEFYSDSSGKSGGQKEKLAYTILASALAYQFGLEWGAARSRSFRFVVIDEAFGRGSDESTRYGLDLFKKLNLQLLIVTPLQKINIIEDYIRAVHFVHNEDGKNSVVRNLTIEEYRAEKEAYLKGAAAVDIETLRHAGEA